MQARWLALLQVPRYTVFPDIRCSFLLLRSIWVCEQFVLLWTSAQSVHTLQRARIWMHESSAGGSMCRAMSNLAVHQKIRSQSEDESEQNFLKLCGDCLLTLPGSHSVQWRRSSAEQAASLKTVSPLHSRAAKQV